MTRLQKLTAYHERVRMAALGEPIEEQRRYKQLLHAVENEMRICRGMTPVPWVQTEFDEED